MSLDLDDPAILRQLSPKARAEVVKRVAARTSAQRQLWFCDRPRACDGKPHGKFPYRHARSDQWPPPGLDWLTWVLRGGRGSGKTRTGAEYTRHISKKIKHIALVGPTGPHVRDIMIEGESGLEFVCKRAGEPCTYEPSKGRVTFQSGAVAQVFSAEKPARLRGPSHGFAWADEPAHWDYVDDVWDMLKLTLRVGARPHILATTTPLPSEWMIKTLAEDSTIDKGVSTYGNIDNLAPSFSKMILDQYEGTYLGRQEIYGEIINDREGALWKSEELKYFDLEVFLGTFERIVVGVDPAGSQGKKSDLTGIVVVGIIGGSIYVIDDLTGKFSPSGWARKVMFAYEKYKADAVIVERNYGGDMVRSTLVAETFEGRIIEGKAVDGKRLRAEPISALYEQERAFHARGGQLAKLEAEMVSWIPGEGKSPNRVDALVWAATDLTKRKGKGDWWDPTKSGRIGGTGVTHGAGESRGLSLGRGRTPWSNG